MGTTWTSNWSSDDDKKDKKDKDTPVKVTEASDSMEEAAESADDDDEKEKELSWRERLEQRREKMRADLKKRREARKQREEAKAKIAAVDEKPEETPVVEEVVADETPAEVVEEATEDEVVVEDEPSLVEDIVEEAVNCPENAVFNEQSQECECEQGYTGDATQGCARACPLNSQFNERRDVCECLDGYEGDATDPEVGCTVPEQDNSGARSALSLHNQYRRRHGASALSWSTELEKVAQDWANIWLVRTVRCTTPITQAERTSEEAIGPSMMLSPHGTKRKSSTTTTTLASAPPPDTSPRSCGRAPRTWAAPLPRAVTEGRSTPATTILLVTTGDAMRRMCFLHSKRFLSFQYLLA